MANQAARALEADDAHRKPCSHEPAQPIRDRFTLAHTPLIAHPHRPTRGQVRRIMSDWSSGLCGLRSSSKERPAALEEVKNELGPCLYRLRRHSGLRGVMSKICPSSPCLCGLRCSRKERRADLEEVKSEMFPLWAHVCAAYGARGRRGVGPRIPPSRSAGARTPPSLPHANAPSPVSHSHTCHSHVSVVTPGIIHSPSRSAGGRTPPSLPHASRPIPYSSFLSANSNAGKEGERVGRERETWRRTRVYRLSTSSTHSPIHPLIPSLKCSRWVMGHLRVQRCGPEEVLPRGDDGQWIAVLHAANCPIAARRTDMCVTSGFRGVDLPVGMLVRSKQPSATQPPEMARYDPCAAPQATGSSARRYKMII
jgi:hypothetical protein